MRQQLTYTINSGQSNINIEILNKHHDRICIFDSNPISNNNKYIQTSQLIAIGCIHELIVEKEGNALDQLQQFINENKNWIFGYLSYDLKNEIENISSSNSDGLNFPLLHFFVPKVVIQINGTTAHLHYDDKHTSKAEAEDIYKLATSSAKRSEQQTNKVELKPKINKQNYIDSVDKLKKHIRLGDIYEINFCQEFYSENIDLNTVSVYEKLNKISQAPFSAYCRFNDHYLLCASPERFIQKTGKRLISQPIKGTTKRSDSINEDERLKNELKNSAKELSENIMIVDIVRNDLSRVAKRGTVKVDELFGIYSFKQVHQLISTIECQIKDNIAFVDIIKSTFPMGSMTGAPKINAMKLIEQYESSKRGLYSGAVGYITPDGDFDFNVVIRSILYNATKHYISFMVGGAITDRSDAEKEYEECLLKAKALFEVLENQEYTH